jgi:Ni/Fe-hydrogenase subunit HybB-like protein
VRSPRRGLFGGGPDEGGRRVWPWALGSALLALIVGFALGALVLDRHIRRKYGGLRIY